MPNPHVSLTRPRARALPVPFAGLRRLLLRLWRRCLESREHALTINTLEGTTPEVLRDIGVAPELVAELEALEFLKQRGARGPQYW